MASAPVEARTAAAEAAFTAGDVEKSKAVHDTAAAEVHGGAGR
jgi:hypothetical protein